MGGFSISPDQRRQIEAKASSLRREITAATSDRPAIGVALAKLLAAFPTQDPGVSAALRIDAYAEALGDLPGWAVASACQRVIRGEAMGSDGKPFDKRFAPTPPQLAELARGIVKPLRQDLSDLLALGHAAATKEPSAEERQRVGDGLTKLAGEMKARNVDDTEAIDARRRAHLDEGNRRALQRECEEAGADATGMASPALLDRLGVKLKPMRDAAE